jgi:transcription elongation factor Elf1
METNNSDNKKVSPINKRSDKKYKCAECGHEKVINTNHYLDVYSLGNFNTCPKCAPFKRPNTWVCIEQNDNNPDSDLKNTP